VSVDDRVSGPATGAAPGRTRLRGAGLARLVPGGIGRSAWRVVERNGVAYSRQWYLFLTGLVEPALYLLSIGIGVGDLVGKVPGPGGQMVTYKEFVAPGLMAAAAMNGAVLDTTFNFFFKFKYAHTFDAMLATPLQVRDVAVGETTWALLRGALYSTAFLVTMVLFGLVHSWWSILAIPGGLLIAFAFAGAGIAGTTFMRSWLDFDFVNLAIIPMFLFSATFFPISQYPDAIATIVRLTPLYQGVVLERALILGHVEWILLVHAAYLLVVGWAGMRIATRRLARLLQP
jgi:lipooligosaccharide transport system permease protein